MEVKRNFSLIDLFIVVFLAFRPFYIFLPLSGFFMIHFCFTGKSLLGQLWNFFRDDVIPTTEHSPPLFYSLYLALFAFDWLFLPLIGFLWFTFFFPESPSWASFKGVELTTTSKTMFPNHLSNHHLFVSKGGFLIYKQLLFVI